MCPSRAATASCHWSRNSDFLFDRVAGHRGRDELAAFGVTRCKRELQEDDMAEDARGGSPSGELEFVAPLRAQAPEEVTAHAEADAVLFEAVEWTLVIVVEIHENLLRHETVPVRVADWAARDQPIPEPKDRRAHVLDEALVQPNAAQGQGM